MNQKEKEIKNLSDERYIFVDKQMESWNETDYYPVEIDIIGNKIVYLIKLNRNELSFEFIMEEMSKLGDSPQLLYDGNGRWCVTNDGYSNLNNVDEPGDVESHFYIVKEHWKETPREALNYYLDRY